MWETDKGDVRQESRMGTNHVNQIDSEVRRVSGDGVPSDSLAPGSSIPLSALGGVGDGQRPCRHRKEKGSREDGEGTHVFGWREGKGKERRESEGEVSLFNVLERAIGTAAAFVAGRLASPQPAHGRRSACGNRVMSSRQPKVGCLRRKKTVETCLPCPSPGLMTHPPLTVPNLN